MKSMRIKMIGIFVLLIIITGVVSLDTCLAEQDTYYQIAQDVGKNTGVPAYIIMAVMKRESDFNPSAISSAGAIGLMQIMVESAEEVGVPANQLFDPYHNILAGTRYLKKMKSKFNNWGKAFAAYYLGPGRLERNELKENHWIKLLDYLKGIDKNIKHYRSKYDAA